MTSSDCKTFWYITTRTHQRTNNRFFSALQWLFIKLTSTLRSPKFHKKTCDKKNFGFRNRKLSLMLFFGGHLWFFGISKVTQCITLSVTYTLLFGLYNYRAWTKRPQQCLPDVSTQICQLFNVSVQHAINRLTTHSSSTYKNYCDCKIWLKWWYSRT